MTATGIKPFKPDSTDLASCDTKDLDCVDQAFGNIAYRHGPESAIDRLGVSIGRSDYLKANCHRITHAIGSAVHARYEGITEAAFVANASICAAGYFHGLLATSLDGVRSTPYSLGTRAVSTCAEPLIARTEYVRMHCMHFMGHAIMVWSGNQLMLALQACEEFVDRVGHESCYSGAFMENFVSVDGVTRSSWVRRDDLNYPCNIVASRYKYMCYQTVGVRALGLLNGDWKKAVGVCASAEWDWRPACVVSLGRSAAVMEVFAPDATERICARTRSHYVSCVEGAAEAFANQVPSGGPAGRFCDGVRKFAQVPCYRRASQLIVARSEVLDDQLASCKPLKPRAYRDACELEARARSDASIRAVIDQQSPPVITGRTLEDQA